MTERPLDVLRRAVLTQSGEWTGDRAYEVVASCFASTLPHSGRGRSLLADLANEGLLDKHPGRRPQTWTLTEEGERQRPAVLAASRITADLDKGIVNLNDVRELVAAVLGEPLPHDRSKT